MAENYSTHARCRRSNQVSQLKESRQFKDIQIRSFGDEYLLLIRPSYCETVVFLTDYHKVNVISWMKTLLSCCWSLGFNSWPFLNLPHWIIKRQQTNKKCSTIIKYFERVQYRGRNLKATSIVTSNFIVVFNLLNALSKNTVISISCFHALDNNETRHVTDDGWESKEKPVADGGCIKCAWRHRTR